MSLISSLKARQKRIGEDPRMKKLKKFFQRVIVIGIVALIIYQISGIGWQEVLRSLPTNPLFYLIFVLLYSSLPVAETLVYRQVWPIPFREGLKALLTKRVYNHEVVGYSGEFYLFLWGRKRVNKSDKEIFKSIRDNAILSAATSNLVAVLILTVLLYTGTLDLSDIMNDVNLLYLGAGVVILGIVIALIVQFRRYLFDLPAGKAAVIFAIYFTRFVLHHAGMMLMWFVAMPGVSWTFWFTFLALFVVVNRIPFLPSKDLVFMWAGIEYSRMLDVTMASVAGMLLVYSALFKALNLILFMFVNWYSKDPEKNHFAGKPDRESGNC